MPRDSRIEAARKRVGAAKRAVALADAAGFVVTLGLARHAHPAAATSSSHQSGSQQSGSSFPSSTGQGFSLGGGSIGPSSGGSPSLSTQTS